jgi:hypothetical protein
MAEEIINKEILPVETFTFGDTDPKPKSYWKKIHENLIDAFGVGEVPDEVTFEKKIKDPKYAKLIHDNLVDAYGKSEVPDFKSFTDSLTIISPEKKNLGLSGSNLSGILSDPTELPLSFTKNSVQQPALVQNPDPFDKNANPAVLARQSYELKKPKQAKENVSVTAMGLPVISYDKKYDENDINISKEIDKYLEESGYSKDFINQVSRIPESYRQSTGYTDQELSDLYRNDRNSFNKRTSEVLFREELASGMNDIKSAIMKNSSLTPEEKDLKLSKIQDEEFLQNQEAMSTGGGFKNKQYFIGQTAKRIKQFIADPEKQKNALEDLATYAADDFGSLEDLEDKKNNPISPNINEEQSVALNYLEQIDPDKAAFYKKYLDVDKNELRKFEYKGYQQIFKELDEIGLNLSINSAQNEIKPLVDLAKEQGGRLDPVDYEKYSKLLETINLASTRLAKIDLLYPGTENLDLESIAQDLVGGRTSMLGIAGRKLMYGLGATAKGIVDLAAAPLRTKEQNDNAAMEALGFQNYIAPTTTPTSKNSLTARGQTELTPELESQRQSIEKDSSLSQDQKVDKMIDLLRRNPDQYKLPSNETSWNVGFFPIVSSLLNFTADIAPFIVLETLTAGGATPTAGYGLVKSFGKMFANVAATSYTNELATQLKEKNPNPEQAAFTNIVVNTIAYKVAGASDMVKAIRGASKELGGVVEKAISKLDDKAILTALKKPNPTLKSFLSDFAATAGAGAQKGFKSGAAFETVIGAKEALEGEKVDSEFIKRRVVGLLNFTLFNVATKSILGVPKIDKQSKEALFLAATNRDEVLYQAEKSLANKEISEPEYNQIKNNVDAAYKVLERVPMVNGKGEQLSRKEATELMYLKIQEQFIEDKIKKDLPKEVQEKITKELADVQDKIDKVYKGTFIEDAGKPFAGLEDREAKRKIKETAEKESVSTETKPTEVKVAEEINADAGKEPVIEEKDAEKKTLESELRDALSYDYYESQLNSEDQWERENAKKYLADPKKYFESKIEDAKDVLSNNPDNESSKNVLDNYTEKLRLFNEITNKYKQSTAKEPVIKGEAIPSEVKATKLPITEEIPEVTVEGLRNGYEVFSGNKANSIGDIRGEVNERRSKGEKFFIKETVKDGKNIFTLVDTTVYDEFARPAYKAASVEVPKNSRLSAEALMSKLKSELGVTDKTNLQYLDKMTSEMKLEQDKTAEVKVTEEVKPTEVKPIDDIESKKADIENKRKEELKKKNTLPRRINDNISDVNIIDSYVKDENGYQTENDVNEGDVLIDNKGQVARIYKNNKGLYEVRYRAGATQNLNKTELFEFLFNRKLSKAKIESTFDSNAELAALKEVKPTEIKTTEVKPTEVIEEAPITAPDVEIPVTGEAKPTKTPEEVKISKKALGDNYNFSKEFDARGGDVVATDVLEQVTKKAEKNNTDVKTQRAIDVENMYKTDPEPTEYNIITAGSHLLEIDNKIAKAQEAGNKTEVENLTEQRNRTLSVLRKLGNKAGRNLGLFNLAFMMEAEGDRSEIKVTRNNLKKILKVDDLPETLADLNKSDLTAEQRKLVIPYIKKLEKIKTEYDPVEKKVYENIAEINNEEVIAAIEKARAEGKKEGIEEGMKSASTELKQKKSKKIKDLAAQIRRSDEFDKFLQGSGPLGDVKKAGVVDLGSYKEIVANVLEAVAKAVELGENVTEAIKKASQKFADVDQGKLISDVRTIMSRASLPSKKEAMDKISEIAKAQGVTGITKEMSDQGLIKDVVNSYLGTDLTNDKILEAATNDLKSILPSVTKENLSNAYVERGEFKKETKAKIENKIDEKKADVKRLAIKEARLEALEAADDYHLEETKEGKKRIKSDYEKELDDKINALLKEKKGIQKQEKVSRVPKTEQDKIDEINREIEYVKATKSVYQQAIKNPKKASEALIAARKEREETYAAYGLKLEKNAKSPILVERDYQDAVKEIENSDLSDAEKNSKIEELTAQRDLDLQGTKQGVVSLLSDDVSNYVKSNLENADLNNNLKSILNGLEPTGEKLDDQINKAYTKLNKLLEDKSLSKEERDSINKIIADLENNNQLTSDQLSAQRLKKQWENEIRKAETDIASGNFTKIPNNTYDYRRNDQLVILNKARENKTGQYNRLVADAREKNRTLGEKALDLSTKFLVSGIHTATKVLEAATFKPFMDSVVDITAGNIASYLFTGAPKTSFYSIKKGYKTFAAFKNKEEAQKYIQKLQNDRDAALNKLQEANESGNQSAIKKADKEFKKADLEYAVSTLYNSIETNVLNSFWQYMKHGATDYDVNIGKSSKKDISEYRTILGKTGYVLDGWIRMHGAMKSSLSARPEMMKVFSSTLKDFQNKGKELSPENISLAMVLAADAYEAGRLTSKTALSKIISRGKGSEKYPAIRYLTKVIMPVSTIAVNLAKRGIDYSTLGAEGFVRLANETKKGMKLNEVEGKTYDGIMSRIKDGWNQIPLKERVYINGVIGRGLFGSAMAMATMYGLSNGLIKYGGTFEDQKKRKIMGTDGEQLKAGEWEFFGERMPKAASLFLNHLPEFLTLSLIADNYQINQMGGSGEDKFETTIDEIQARFPFQTIAGAFVPGKRLDALVDRFTRVPIAAEAATLFDEKAEFRDKSDFINRIRGNIGLGFLNATKEQQKQIDQIRKSLRKLPSGTLTPADQKEIDSVIEEIKNIDFGELETKKAMEEMKKELEKQ